MTDYCTPAELRTQIEKTGTTGSGSDAALTVIITAASRAIDTYCNRPDGFVALSVATARYYTGRGTAHLLIDECTAVSAVAVKDSSTDTTYTAWAATDYQACTGDPRSPDWNSTPYTMLMCLPSGNYSVFISGQTGYMRGFRPTNDEVRQVPTVSVTAKWGYATTCPAAVKEACIALSARWFKQGQSAWADTLASSEMGQLIYQRENQDIKMMLMRYVKPAIGRW